MDKVIDLKPDAINSITFDRNGKEIGRLILEKDGIKFIGNADKSAKVFFNHFLKDIVDNYMKEKFKEKGES